MRGPPRAPERSSAPADHVLGKRPRRQRRHEEPRRQLPEPLHTRRATSHWLVLDFLKQYGAEPTGEWVVTDGKYVTAAGVSSGIDMGLTLVGRIAGDEHAQAVQLLTECDPQPPYDAGSPQQAPAHLVDEFRTNSRFSLV